MKAGNEQRDGEARTQLADPICFVVARPGAQRGVTSVMAADACHYALRRSTNARIGLHCRRRKDTPLRVTRADIRFRAVTGMSATACSFYQMNDGGVSAVSWSSSYQTHSSTVPVRLGV